MEWREARRRSVVATSEPVLIYEIAGYGTVILKICPSPSGGAPKPMFENEFGNPYTSIPFVITTAIPPAKKKEPMVAISGGTLR